MTERLDSGHLDFLPEIRPDTSAFDAILTRSDLPDEVRGYYQNLIKQADDAVKEIHRTNCLALTQRVIHKYHKWGKTRFGSTLETQMDFYDGSEKIDSVIHPIVFDPMFEECLRNIAKDEFHIIKDNLHIGQSAVRFRDYLSCANKVIYPKEITMKLPVKKWNSINTVPGISIYTHVFYMSGKPWRLKIHPPNVNSLSAGFVNFCVELFQPNTYQGKYKISLAVPKPDQMTGMVEGKEVISGPLFWYSFVHNFTPQTNITEIIPIIYNSHVEFYTDPKGHVNVIMSAEEIV